MDSRRTGIGFACALLAVFCVCEVVDDSTDTSVDVESLRILTTDITNWTDRADGSFTGYEVFVGTDICNPPIDGACGPYNEQGVVKSIIQYMGRPTGTPDLLYNMDAFAMDFGTPAKAMAMFEAARPSSGTAMAGYATTVVVIDETTPNFGVTVFGHFDKFYIELKMDNYTVKEDAITDAKLFMDIYAAKING